jgi:hypothetical protein
MREAAFSRPKPYSREEEELPLQQTIPPQVPLHRVHQSGRECMQAGQRLNRQLTGTCTGICNSDGHHISHEVWVDGVKKFTTLHLLEPCSRHSQVRLLCGEYSRSQIDEDGNRCCALANNKFIESIAFLHYYIVPAFM